MSWSDARLVSWRSPSRWQHQDVIFLSDIPEELPWPFLGPRATGSWRRDRSIHGNPITIGGHGFTKGLGTQASSVISFHVPEGMTAFVSDVGDDDEVPTERRGPRTRAVVLVDGRERYRSPELEPRQRMTDVRVPLDGARRVTLITEAGPQGDAVDWGDARFVRGAGT